MTAEIAILNKLAVTLAADSAVTISTGGSSKVYNSADKIFEATNYDPIGIMVWNNPELHGIPIEAIVKMYRDRVCRASCATVFEFADLFLKHLEGLDSPAVTVEQSIFASLFPTMFHMKSVHSDVSSRLVQTIQDIPEAERTGDRILEMIRQGIVDAFSGERAAIEALNDQPWADGLTVERVLDAHSTTVGEVIDSVFEGVELTDDARAVLTDISILTLLKDYPRSILTGLVFAGFGTNEIFPSLIAYEIYGTVAGRLKFIEANRFDVDRKLVPVAQVFPFAQQEMVDRFIYGLDNQFLQLCDNFLDGSFTELKSRLGAAPTDDETEAVAALKSAVEAGVDGILSEFRNAVVKDHLRRSREQLSDMVRSMPKQELAALAESLVHITSLKRKFSADAESVGGPIDVAMITRAEGFVWVKRKHFFEASLNPRYFYRRYGRGASGDKEESK